jgi:hypothetical protein
MKFSLFLLFLLYTFLHVAHLGSPPAKNPFVMTFIKCNTFSFLFYPFFTCSSKSFPASGQLCMLFLPVTAFFHFLNGSAPSHPLALDWYQTDVLPASFITSTVVRATIASPLALSKCHSKHQWLRRLNRQCAPLPPFSSPPISPLSPQV